MLWSRGLARSPEKRKLLYIRYLSAYGHKIWQEGNLPRWAPTYKVIRLFYHVIFQVYVANRNLNVSTTRVPSAYDHQNWQDGNLPWWWSSSYWQTKTIMFPLLQSLWQPSLAGLVHWGVPIDIITWLFNHLVLLDHKAK